MRLLLLLTSLCLLCQPALSQGLSLTQVKAKLASSQAKIEDISATARLEFQLKVGILPYNDSLDGTYLYKKPDKHKLDFPKAPSYLKSVPSMFSWKLPGDEKYDCQVVGPVKEGSNHLYRLVYSSKNPSSKTDSITVWVDASKWRIEKQDTLYKDGGSVLLQFAYKDWKGNSLLERVSGDLNLPAYSLRGKAAIGLSGHKVNQGLKDSAFD